MQNLIELEACSNTTGPALTIQPLPPHAWEPFLTCMPDQRFAAYLRRGINLGFRIGFDRDSPLKSSRRNHSSVYQLMPQVDSYLHDEISANRLTLVPPSTQIHINPMGLIPKKNRPGKFRLIVDLSAPQGKSVNDGISSQWCSFKYTSINEATKRIPQGSFMAKLDLKSAYRMIPVHPNDRHLLGISWRGSVLQDSALPFGLRSAPIIFSAVADALAWAMLCSGIPVFLHYLDDFLFWAADYTTCLSHLNNAIAIASKLGLPVEPTKVEGPATSITFLGIEIDSINLVLRLPQSKLTILRHLLSAWENKRSATKRDFQVLLGHLNHAATVVPAGRSFLRCLIDAMSKLKQPHHYSRLDIQCRSDLAWWCAFIERWNGINFFPSLPQGPTVIADASGSWGCGAYCLPTSQWFQIQWPLEWAGTDIAAKELFPLVIAAAVWGSSWSGHRVTFKSDNIAAVQSLLQNRAKDPYLSHLLRCLFFFRAHFRFEVVPQHIAGSLNTAADALSRNNISKFYYIFPQAPHLPVTTPQSLIALLLDHNLNWTSPRWRTLFNDCLSKELPPAPAPPIHQPSVNT